ncbi:membrane-bound lytic murein transglycosylase F [Sinobacterium caligoides]|uniref:Membrane-bound lytic murein transglycosylase F n=1 Tax=Sinobacterium caligoides TaxID=933926 RepID=A0A3N2DZ15_9GAMM|nr:transporter substrate-binding domain-containing protein [Sinobacterium caligoides]ROS04739.1 membrane-bound lytic murein transglycosylase F [Sinobacterium caligoides]
MVAVAFRKASPSTGQMRALACCFAMAMLLMLWGCDGAHSPNVIDHSESPVVSGDSAARYMGDLDDIEQTGHLRIAAVRHDVAALLNRTGLPATSYHDLAEEFAASLDLKAKWIYFDDLPAALESASAGASDLVMSNITVSQRRRDRYQVEFTRPLLYVDELVVGRHGSKRDKYDEFVVTVGSAYLDTLKGTDYPLALLPADTQEEEILHWVSKAEKPLFTLMDGDIVAALLPNYPRLKSFGVLAKSREISWALRDDSPQLRDKLNQFLLASDLLYQKQEVRDWAQIKAAGVLRVVTFNSPTTYFMKRGYHAGFEYDLIKAFAKQHKLKLRIILVDNLEQLYAAVTDGFADVAAASLNPTAERDAIMQGTSAYLYTRAHLISQPADKGVEAKGEAPAKIEVAMNPNSGYLDEVEALGYKVVKVPSASAESLSYQVLTKRYQSTVVDGHFAKLLKVMYPSLVLTPLEDQLQPHVWYHARKSKLLNDQLNRFIAKEYKGLHYNVVYNNYFKNVTKKSLPSVLDPDKPLSPYDALFKKYAKLFNYDWRLIAAQAFQESHFNRRAKSASGARGLMQVMPRTGRAYGVSDLYDPEQSLIAAAKHLQWLYDRFPMVKISAERVWFALAAYNAGHGHVYDAQVLARKMGLKDDVWDGNVAKAMLALSDPKNYKRARYGYVRGTEPVKYVREIKERYRSYSHTYK